MSVTTARKERERAVREELILDHGLRLLLRDGYQNLNLDELATAIEYSKGTIYLHFQTKEDLVLGIATRALKERTRLFERAAENCWQVSPQPPQPALRPRPTRAVYCPRSASRASSSSPQNRRPAAPWQFAKTGARDVSWRKL